MIILFWLTHILSIPSYDTSIDQTYVKISGKNEIIERTHVIKECSLDKLEFLEIEEGIIEIGSESFKSASKLSKVILPNNLKTLGSNCFEYCSELKSIILPEGLEIIKDYSLADTGLVNVTFPSSLKSVDAYLSFVSCKNLTKFIMPKSGVFSVDSKETMLVYNKTIAYAVASGVTSIVIPDYIATINNDFAKRKSVKVLEFSNKTTLKEIQSGAFAGSEITKFLLPEGLETIGNSALGTQATYVWLPSTLVNVGNIFNPNMKIENIENCPGVFQNSEGVLMNKDKDRILLLPKEIRKFTVPNTLKSIDGNIIRQSNTIKSLKVENGNPTYFDYENGLYQSSDCSLYAFPGNISKAIIAPNCTSINRFAFSGTKIVEVEFRCTNLKKIMYAAFELCTMLRVMELPQTITSIEACSLQGIGLKSFKFPKNIKSIPANTFYGDKFDVADMSECLQLTSISTSAFELNLITKLLLPPNLQTISRSAFYRCKNLEEVVFPSTIRSIGDICFLRCAKLSKVKFSSPSNLTNLNLDIFKGSNITEIEIPASVTEISQGALAQCPQLRSITFEKESKLNSIRKGAFSGTNLTKELILPSKIQSIDEQSLTEMYGLESITFDGESSIYKSVNGVVFTKDGKELVVFPPGLNKYTVEGNVERIANSAFYKCIKLEKLIINPTVPLRSIGENTFMDCIELSKLEFPSATENLSSNCFSGCISISEVSFAAGSQLKILGSGSFSRCQSLKKIEFKYGSMLETIDANAFSECSRLEGFDFPKSVKTISASAFSNCVSLCNVSFERDSILETIGASAFEGCSKLSEVIFPPTTKKIGRDSFRGCKNLYRVIYCGNYSISMEKESDSIFTGVSSVQVFVSIRYPISVEKLGELKVNRWLDGNCQFPTGQFTVSTVESTSRLGIAATVMIESGDQI